jgi:hypothetical protein
VLTVPDVSTSFFNITLIARESSSTNVGAYKFEFSVLKETGVATIAIASGIVDKSEVESVLGWDANVSVNTGDGSVRLIVLGTAATTIRWVAKVCLVQVSF